MACASKPIQAVFASLRWQRRLGPAGAHHFRRAMGGGAAGAGEKWFWDTLVDADLASNSASWQWVAGCDADAAPYFRVFNPSLQGAKFDPNGDYVRRWVPEIGKLPNTLLHSPWEARPIELADAGIRLDRTYPAPIIDHGGARQRALEAFKQIKIS